MTLGYPEKLMKESRFYKETLGMGRVEDSGGRVLSALAARFGSIPCRLSLRIHSIREINRAMLDYLLKLAVTAKDIGDFERMLGEI